MPVTSAVVTLLSVFTLASDFVSNEISGYLATSSQLAPCKCSFCIGFCTVKDSAATTIFPLVAAGFSGSNETVPLMPLALPLMDSSGASRLKTAVLMPFGSLKSKVCGAA